MGGRGLWKLVGRGLVFFLCENMLCLYRLVVISRFWMLLFSIGLLVMLLVLW